MIALLASVLLGAAALVFSRSLAHVSAARETLVRSFASGVSLAFVMLDLFVELAQGAAGEIHDIVRMGPRPVHTMAVLLLLGTMGWLVAAAFVTRRGSARQLHAAALMPHIVYSALVGAAIIEEAHEGALPVSLFWVAMAIHLGVVDHHFAERFPGEHRERAAAASLIALVAGALTWVTFAPPKAVFHVLLAVVAGGTLLGTLREELPSLNRVRILPVVAGAAASGLFIQLRWWL